MRIVPKNVLGKVAGLAKKLSLGLGALSMMLSVSLLNAAPAAAYTSGNVWVNFSSTMCTGGGSVVGIYWAVDNYSSGPASGDWGDNTIYPKVRVGTNSYNTLSFSLYCKKWGFYTYKAGDGQKNLYPYKSGLSYTYSSYF
jgi:hypothetical protein